MEVVSSFVGLEVLAFWNAIMLNSVMPSSVLIAIAMMPNQLPSMHSDSVKSINPTKRNSAPERSFPIVLRKGMPL